MVILLNCQFLIYLIKSSYHSPKIKRTELSNFGRTKTL